MADVSKIIMSDGSTLDIKDAIARGMIIQISQNDYNNLTPQQRAGKVYFVYDAASPWHTIVHGDGTKTTSWTADVGYYAYYNYTENIVTVDYTFKVMHSGTNVGRWTNLFTGFPKPVANTYFIQEGAPLVITTSGNLQNVYEISSTTFYRGHVTYITTDF